MGKNNPLSPQDRHVLAAKSGSSWVPPEPAELLLPYMERTSGEVERDSIESRRQKAKEVYDGYGDIIENCKKLEDELSQKCKNVKITLNPSDHLHVINALKRVFGFTDITEITFDMYKTIVQALAKLEDAGIPKPGDNL